MFVAIWSGCMHWIREWNLPMAMLTVNLTDEVHRALSVRSARKGRSIEAEMCAILEETVLPEGRVTLGALLMDVGRRTGLTEEEWAELMQRDTSPPRPMDLD